MCIDLLAALMTTNGIRGNLAVDSGVCIFTSKYHQLETIFEQRWIFDEVKPLDTNPVLVEMQI